MFNHRRHPPEVISRRDDRDVSHIQRELWQVDLYVGPFGIPSPQCLDGMSVTEVMDAWTTAIAIAHASRLEQSAQGLLHAALAIGAPATAAVAQQWRVRPTIDPRLFLADLKILAQFNQRRGRQRNPARLVELLLADSQHTGSIIDIIKPQTQQFPQA